MPPRYRDPRANFFETLQDEADHTQPHCEDDTSIATKPPPNATTTTGKETDTQINQTLLRNRERNKNGRKKRKARREVNVGLASLAKLNIHRLCEKDGHEFDHDDRCGICWGEQHPDAEPAEQCSKPFIRMPCCGKIFGAVCMRDVLTTGGTRLCPNCMKGMYDPTEMPDDAGPVRHGTGEVFKHYLVMAFFLVSDALVILGIESPLDRVYVLGIHICVCMLVGSLFQGHEVCRRVGNGIAGTDL